MDREDREAAATELRWFLTKRWGDVSSHPRVLELIDIVVGYPREGAQKPDDPWMPPVNPDPPLAPLPIPTGKKVALIVGHNARSKGAYCKAPVKEFEYDFNNRVVDLMIENAPEGLRLMRYNRVYQGSYVREIDAVYRRVNDWDPDLAVELHFNGGGGNYICMLAARSSHAAQNMASEFADTFEEHLGFPNKGVFARFRSERGGRSLYAARAKMTLTEPFFGDRDGHASKIGKLGHKGVAMIYLEAIARVLNKS